MRFLIGTVPYGKDNVGDEAILASIVNEVKDKFLDAEITVSTGTPEETSKKFSIRTVPLFGLDPEATNSFNLAGITRDSKQLLLDEMRRTDVYIWGGATGLSDYPDYGVYVARIAKKFSKNLVLYSVGMNNEFNPTFYKIMEGRKKYILDICQKLTFNCIDFVKAYEKYLDKRIKKLIKNSLNNADLIITRDDDSKREIENCGVTKQIITTSDPAILLKPASGKKLEAIWKDQDLWDEKLPIVGIGISSQKMIHQMDDFVHLLDYLVEKKNVNILFIPMNPITDAEVMDQIHKKMKFGERAKMLNGYYDPDEIIAVTSKLSLVISSRLHLLILSSINYLPIIGISRGTKISSFLSLFGEEKCGTVESFNFETIKETCDRLLQDKSIFMDKSKDVVKGMQIEARKNIDYLSKLIKT